MSAGRRVVDGLRCAASFVSNCNIMLRIGDHHGSGATAFCIASRRVTRASELQAGGSTSLKCAVARRVSVARQWRQGPREWVQRPGCGPTCRTYQTGWGAVQGVHEGGPSRPGVESSAAGHIAGSPEALVISQVGMRSPSGFGSSEYLKAVCFPNQLTLLLLVHPTTSKAGAPAAAWIVSRSHEPHTTLTHNFQAQRTVKAIPGDPKL